jgi:hypothetical protein
MSTKSNIAVIAAFLTVLAGPAYATNGDIGLSDHGQGASQGGGYRAPPSILVGSLVRAMRKARARHSTSI